MTHPAQATISSNATSEQRTLLDIEYVGTMSFQFDLHVIALTVQQVIFKGGI